MDCSRCRKEIEADSAFCRHCGSPAALGSQPRKLFRRSAVGRIAGVCAGIADYFNADVTLVRVVWVVLSIVPGTLIGGVVAYLVAWIVIPDMFVVPAVEDTSAKRLTRSTVDRKIGGVCGGIAEYLTVDPTVVRLVWAVLSIFPGAIVLGVAAYLVAWFIMPETHRQAMTAAPSAAA